MSTARLCARTPSAKKIDIATLRQHQLFFHHASEKDNSAKCNALFTGNNQHVVHGVLFEINPDEKPVLDRCESLGIGYEECIVEVAPTRGGRIEALTYISMRVEPAIQPFSWYKEHVLRGAMEHALPRDYLAAIDAVECINDHNLHRHQTELSIYYSSTTGSTSSGQSKPKICE